ncbi:MAG: nodulation protein NfeD [Chloroflexi bacterium]|nr:nodulation protein NfeD [Chloroflexota bacterium]
MPNLLTHEVVRAVRVLAAVLIMLIGLLGITTSFTSHSVYAQTFESTDERPHVVLIRLDGAIDGVSARFIDRGIDTAISQDSQLIVLMLDTPGGLLDATRDVVESILASKVPVVVYVAPDGAQAASAGTFIGAAAHILAMAPTTNLGAASIINSDGSELTDTLSKKVSQDAAAFIRSIAERRGRNVSALEGTVLSASAYSASEAVELGIADLIAPDYESLLSQLGGYELVINDSMITLNLSGADTTTIDLSLLERLLAFISNPNIAFLLVSLGGLGVIVELWNPGLWVPGTMGALFLILGWAGVGQLPFSWAGVALILLSLLLFYLETTATGIGYFGVAGSISLILGGLFLVGFFGSPSIPGDAPMVSRWLLAVVGVIAGSVVLWFAAELRKTKFIPPYLSPTLSVSLVGATGVVSVDLTPLGQVFVNGEYWSGEINGDPGDGVSVGTEVQVVSVDGIHLYVMPVRTGACMNDVSNSNFE